MRILITGGTGLIGRQLAGSLAGDGHEVVVLSRNPSQATGMPAGARLERWDAKTSAGWAHLANGADAIVNLAGESLAEGRWTEARKQAIRDSRVNAGKAVVEAIQAASDKPKVLVQASAVGYYGPRGNEEIAEDARPGTDFSAKICVDWEASTQAVEALGVRRLVVRTGIVLSADGGALPRMLLPFKFFAGGKIGSGEQGFPWIHIADEVAAIRFLIDAAGASGPFNLTAPHPPTNAGFAKAIGQAMGKPSAVPAPGFALKAAFGEMSTVLLDGQRAVPKRLLGLGYTFRFSDPVAALRDLLKK